MRPTSRELALKFGAKEAFSLVELDAALKKGFTVNCAVDFVSTSTSMLFKFPLLDKTANDLICH